MKCNIKYAIKICILSLVLSFMVMLTIYFFLPQHFCNYVYDVHTNYIIGEETKTTEWHEEYQEIFAPSYNYIKTINVYLHCEEYNEKQNINIKLINENGRIMKEETFTLSSEESMHNLAFVVEKWVDENDTYKLVLSMEGAKNVYVPIYIYNNSPEHISLLIDDVNVEGNLCLQYVYGTYSIKRLLLWMLAFYIVWFYLCDIFIKKEDSDKTI